ncbi:MAG: right-handed parallel beta-helix repeat-containing protein [Oscillospiraceae bacterium]
MIAVLTAAAPAVFASGEGRSLTELAPGVYSGAFIAAADRGASALYVSGGDYTFNDSYFYTSGSIGDNDASDELANQYGFCAAVLANSMAAKITLNNPTVLTNSASYSNGVFAANYSEITINGGVIGTANSQGHGIHVTYGGKVCVNDTVISTRGSASAALASDYGGGFIIADGVNCTSEIAGSPGIYCAGSSIIYCRDSSFRAVGAEGVMNAHSSGVTVLDDCSVYGEQSALNGHENLSDIPSYCFVFGGSLSSAEGAPLINESNGNNVVYLVGVDCQNCSSGNIIAAEDDVDAVLTVNVWDTRLAGNIYAGAGSTITVNLYDGGALAGDVFGDGDVTINVYDGGDFHDFGGYPATAMGAGPEAPECGDFDYYLVNYWAPGSQWNGTIREKYLDEVEAVIVANAAVSFTEGSMSSAEYDPTVNDPS